MGPNRLVGPVLDRRVVYAPKPPYYRHAKVLGLVRFV